jgi:hypothetical protein
MAAVQKYGYALQFVQNQTDEICMAAVRQNGFAAVYIKAEIFDRDPYINMLYVAVLESVNFEHNKGLITIDKINKLRKYINQDIIDQVLTVRKRSRKSIIKN